MNKTLKIIGFTAVVLLAVYGFGTIMADIWEPKVNSIGLNAEIQKAMDDSSITVKNNDTFGWYDVVLTINSDYTLELAENSIITAGKTLNFSTTQFIKPDGTKFNSSATKIINLSISAKRDETTKGSILFTW